MIKKVVISAAGQGTRMQELSENKSKHLIEVNSRPFLAYLLDNIIKAGYSEIMLVVGFRQDLVAEFLKTYALPEGVTIGMVNQFEILGPKEKMYGTACPLMCVKDFVGGDQYIF
jgi:choline kinase